MSELTRSAVVISKVAVDITVATIGIVDPVPRTRKREIFIIYQTRQGGIRGTYQFPSKHSPGS